MVVVAALNAPIRLLSGAALSLKNIVVALFWSVIRTLDFCIKKVVGVKLTAVIEERIAGGVRYVKVTLPASSEGKCTAHINQMKAGSLQRARRGHILEKVLQASPVRELNMARLGAPMAPQAVLEETLDLKPAVFRSNPDFYDYAGDLRESAVWVDFAASGLGGGLIREQGFVQEERMLAELPAVVRYMIARYPDEEVIRNPDASPRPLMMLDVDRVRAVDAAGEFYGRDLREREPGLPMDQFVARTVQDLPAPFRKINILAIALLNLGGGARLEQQLSLGVLRQIYVTIHQGFSLARLSKGEDASVHSGRIGCGAFHNHPDFVYLVQRLLASHFGLELALHAYDDLDAGRLNGWWTELLPRLNGISGEQAIRIIGQFVLVKAREHEAAVAAARAAAAAREAVAPVGDAAPATDAPGGAVPVVDPALGVGP